MVGEKKFIVWGALLLLLVVSVSAVPGVPHNFFGSVTVNGQPAPDGFFVEAFINGDVDTTTTSGGKYGYSPDIFYVMDPASNNAGSIITFVVEEITATTSTFINGESTRLNLAINCNDCVPSNDPPPEDEGGSGGGGGGGAAALSWPTDTPAETTLDGGSFDFSSTGGGTGAGVCSANWRCSKWTACSNGAKQRVCIDQNDCGTSAGKPTESQVCDFTDEELYDGEENKGFLTGAVLGGGTATWLGLIIILVGIAGLFYLAKHMRKD